MRFSTLIAAFMVGAVTAAPPSATLQKRGVAFNWGKDKVRGLNIGGWLLLEPWITPSIFQKLDQSLNIVDEMTLTGKLGKDKALEILRPHWDTFCTFKDFKKIADAGFNMVRLPVGYWAYLDVGETYTTGQAPYVDAAIDWARATGLKIVIDLHGAPKSQNGFDNSGQRIKTPGFQQGDSVAQTLQVLDMISKKYAQPAYQDVVIAIQLLNEPLGSALDMKNLEDFYRKGFEQVRNVSDTPVMFHDAFIQPKLWNGFLSVSDKNAQHVIVDHHEYQIFNNDLVALQPWEHRQHVCNNAASYASGADKWTIVGEWTAAMTDCAPALNGYGIGARYDGSFPDSKFVGSCKGKNNILEWDATFKGDMRGYLEAQLSTFESHTQGWVFWNFKTESAHEWDAFALLDNGVFPQPLTKYEFNAICSI
ncbi:hypothetical protein HYALB_00010854 [Hymenoscyphus albidus]|uniref:glucan 1,3-beta-glucosidase n=1 Tax=Hymenoscyphus albidus TaxID=595503 RepID=A0A9N9LI74_9HELO|nr:hypothetical protein HYALB_00010854 [Hymenoscyphus albidus]